jgi:hypothetical protein
MPVAIGADSDLRIGKFLYLLGAAMAGSAFVFVERHCGVVSYLSRYNSIL